MLGALAMLGAAGCGGVLEGVLATSPARELTRAEEVGAAHHAAYDYWSAKEYSEQAGAEAASGRYGSARQLAQESRAHARRAVLSSREAERER